MSKEKIFILILLAIGIVAGLVISYGTYFAMSKTSGANFCVVCHEMDPMVVSYRDDIHGGKGRLGASARCVDCHLPHDNLINYIYSKAKNGVVEGAIHFFGNPEDIDWHANLEHRESYVFDNGCLECHGNVLKDDLATTSKLALKMHTHYQTLQGTDKEIGCASCHFDAGHKGMRNMLNYYKPEHSMYKEKMEEKKKEVQEKYQKYGIKEHVE